MIQVNFPANYNEVSSTPAYQWDTGQILRVYGLNDVTTDAVIEAHFCDKTCERAIVRLATRNGDYYQAPIPNILLENDYDINVFLYVIDGDCKYTIRKVKIPVNKRTRPEDFINEPDPTETTLLEQALNNINLANMHLVQNAEQYIGQVTEIKTSDETQNTRIEALEEDTSGVREMVEEVRKDLYTEEGLYWKFSHAFESYWSFKPIFAGSAKVGTDGLEGINESGLYLISWQFGDDYTTNAENPYFSTILYIPQTSKDAYSSYYVKEGHGTFEGAINFRWRALDQKLYSYGGGGSGTANQVKVTSIVRLFNV